MDETTGPGNPNDETRMTNQARKTSHPADFGGRVGPDERGIMGGSAVRVGSGVALGDLGPGHDAAPIGPLVVGGGELLHDLGMVGGEVVGFGAVGAQVEQFP